MAVEDTNSVPPSKRKYVKSTIVASFGYITALFPYNLHW